MVGKYKAYPEYKDSGVEWLGYIPEHWQIWKLAHAFEIIGSGTTPPSDNNDWYGDDINWVTTGELREDIILSTSKKIKKKTLQYFSTLKIYPKGTILIAMYGATIGRLGILGESATTNQACCALSNSNYLSNMYLFYWLISFRQEIIQLSSGGGQPNINQEKVASLKISTPTLEEQKKIINFLTYETFKIDTLIEKQQQLIKLLEEKRQAVISYAVTNGLNPNVPMRDSGVEWLGEIPEHWQIWKLAHAFEIIGSGTTPPSDTNDWYGDDINWVTTGELREDIILSTSKKIKKKTLQYFSTLKIYPKGTILIAMYGATIGRLGILGESATTNQACCALSNSNYLFNMYLFYWLISFRQEIIQLSSGGGQPNINQEKVAALKISTPTLEEQKEIISFLDQETLKLRHLIAKANKVIELLKERRTALISAAVTGKIDVRDWQAPTVMD